jgi:hypothetical protein
MILVSRTLPIPDIEYLEEETLIERIAGNDIASGRFGKVFRAEEQLVCELQGLMFLPLGPDDIVQSPQYLRRKQYQQAEPQHDCDKAKIGENTDSHILPFFPVLKLKQFAPG